MQNSSQPSNFDVIGRSRKFNGFLKVDQVSFSYEQYDGANNMVVRELLDRGHSVAVLLVDTDQEVFVLVEQFRVGAIDSENPWLLEPVAGMIEEGESAIEVAKREILEETGCTAQAVRELFTFYPSPGGCSETITLCIAETVAPEDGVLSGLASENEDIRVRVLPWGKVFEMLDHGQLNNASIITAVQWFRIQMMKWEINRFMEMEYDREKKEKAVNIVDFNRMAQR